MSAPSSGRPYAAAGRPTGMALLAARDIKKAFGRLTAFRGVDRTVAENEFPRPHRPQGLRQKYADEVRRRLRDADGRDNLLCQTRHHRGVAGRALSRRPQPQVSDHQRAAGTHSLRQYAPRLAGTESPVEPHLLRTRGPMHERCCIPSISRLAARAGDPAAALSHGQQQWLEIAMALAPEPRNDAQLLQLLAP